MDLLYCCYVRNVEKKKKKTRRYILEWQDCKKWPHSLSQCLQQLGPSPVYSVHYWWEPTYEQSTLFSCKKEERDQWEDKCRMRLASLLLKGDILRGCFPFQEVWVLGYWGYRGCLKEYLMKFVGLSHDGKLTSWFELDAYQVFEPWT